MTRRVRTRPSNRFEGPRLIRLTDQLTLIVRRTGNYVTLGDFFMLDTETFEWTELTAENCAGPFPEGRAGHRMVSIRDKLFLFGGGVWDKSRRSWLAKINATHVFDPRT